ncbi:hypothetical protein [Acinetobacter dispersus]|uniref:hypothetical protein n=1 Tax=Acinetobacter dispersus TaxID=70348 RepID=UPI00132F1631|nr:hypothetical protein [Acinetobacter dispersus]QHH97523.1 hypothetical protein FPL17_08120 [Acinetobacter dispersus]
MPILDLQFAFFFANPPINLRFDEFSVNLRKKQIFIDNDLDLNTFIYPVPAEIPADFPRCQITSVDQIFDLTISGARCDVIVKNKLNSSVTTFKSILLEIIELFAQEKIEINRIGYVTRYFTKTENPGLIIREKFLKINDPDLQEPNIRFVFKTDFNGTMCNENYQIEVAQQRNFKTATEDNILLLTQDFNTIPENNSVLNKEFLESFMDNIPHDRLNNYFNLISE